MFGFIHVTHSIKDNSWGAGSASTVEKNETECDDLDPIFYFVFARSLLFRCPPTADTPHYISMAEVPYRIAEIYGTGSYDGSVKYLAILREPVARAVSSWEFKFDRESSFVCPPPGSLSPNERFWEKSVGARFDPFSPATRGTCHDHGRFRAATQNHLVVPIVLARPRRFNENNSYYLHHTFALHACLVPPHNTHKNKLLKPGGVRRRWRPPPGERAEKQKDSVNKMVVFVGAGASRGQQ